MTARLDGVAGGRAGLRRGGHRRPGRRLRRARLRRGRRLPRRRVRQRRHGHRRLRRPRPRPRARRGPRRGRAAAPGLRRRASRRAVRRRGAGRRSRAAGGHHRARGLAGFGPAEDAPVGADPDVDPTADDTGWEAAAVPRAAGAGRRTRTGRRVPVDRRRARWATARRCCPTRPPRPPVHRSRRTFLRTPVRTCRPAGKLDRAGRLAGPGDQRAGPLVGPRRLTRPTRSLDLARVARGVSRWPPRSAPRTPRPPSPGPRPSTTTVGSSYHDRPAEAPSSAGAAARPCRGGWRLAHRGRRRDPGRGDRHRRRLRHRPGRRLGRGPRRGRRHRPGRGLGPGPRRLRHLRLTASAAGASRAGASAGAAAEPAGRGGTHRGPRHRRLLRHRPGWVHHRRHRPGHAGVAGGRRRRGRAEVQRPLGDHRLRLLQGRRRHAQLGVDQVRRQRDAAGAADQEDARPGRSGASRAAVDGLRQAGDGPRQVRPDEALELLPGHVRVDRPASAGARRRWWCGTASPWRRGRRRRAAPAAAAGRGRPG